MSTWLYLIKSLWEISIIFWHYQEKNWKKSHFSTLLRIFHFTLVHRYKKCGVAQSFTCYSKNPPLGSDSANTSYFSSSMIVALGIVGGVLFITISIFLFWFFFMKREIYPSLEKHLLKKFRPAESTWSNSSLIQPLNNEPIFNKVQELIVYNEPTI